MSIIRPYTDKNFLIRAILLIMGYGFIWPCTANAYQRKMSSIDSIANAIMNNSKMLYRMDGYQKNKLEICLRSSDLCPEDSRLPNRKEAFFVYGSSDNKGFVVVSADDRMPEVLAYSYDEVFQIDNMPASTRYWLECYLDDYMNLEAETLVPENPYWQAAEIRPEGVSPLLGKLPWGQGAPYNDLCPLSSIGKCVTGCVATAMAQVMWLHQWPVCGKGDISYITWTHQIPVNMNLAEHPFEWDLIKEEYQQGRYTEEEANAIATLMAACGAAVRMDYDPIGSGAYQHDILKALVNNFNYDPDAAFLPREYFTTTDWHNLLITELNDGRAVNYAGQSRTDGGHSFVIDGYQGGSNGTEPYYHLNWGWEGVCNGYYLLPQLRPAENGKLYVEEGFNESQQMLIGVQPNDGQTQASKMLCAEGIKVMQATLQPGEVATIQVNAITNLHYRTFHGNIGLQLCDSIGKTFVFGGTQIEPIPYFESQNDLTFQFIIPDTLSEGTYSVKLVSINSEGQEAELYSRSSPQIIVLPSPYGGTIEDTDKLTLLCSSEFEVFVQFDMEEQVNMRVYELFNYSDELVEGHLQMEIASEDGVSITTFGTPCMVSAMGSQEVISSPITLSGIIPDTLRNGHYRLYVSFCLSKHPIENRVKYYERANPTNTPAEYFLQMDVEDEKISINNISFPRKTAKIRNSIKDSNTQEHYYNLHGIRHMNRSLRKGLYIYQGCKIHIR